MSPGPVDRIPLKPERPCLEGVFIGFKQGCVPLLLQFCVPHVRMVVLIKFTIKQGIDDKDRVTP